MCQTGAVQRKWKIGATKLPHISNQKLSLGKLFTFIGTQQCFSTFIMPKRDNRLALEVWRKGVIATQLYNGFYVIPKLNKTQRNCTLIDDCNLEYHKSLPIQTLIKLKRLNQVMNEIPFSLNSFFLQPHDFEQNYAMSWEGKMISSSIWCYMDKLL